MGRGDDASDEEGRLGGTGPTSKCRIAEDRPPLIAASAWNFPGSRLRTAGRADRDPGHGRVGALLV